MTTLTFDPKADADFKVLYDAVAQIGYRIQVLDHAGTLQDELKREARQTRDLLMKQARESARTIAHGLPGTVYVGYSPEINLDLQA